MRNELDVITLRGLTARGHHGVLPFEREGSQPFSADVSLWVDTRAAASTDDIDSTVSYADIAEEAVGVLTGPSVYLLETLAQRIADVALAHAQVQGVEVTIHKPMAPLRQQFSDVSVTIRRGAAVAGALPGASRLPSVDEGAPAPSPRRSVGDAGSAAPTVRPPAAGVDPAGSLPVPSDRRTPPTRRRHGDAHPVDDSTWTPVVLALGGNLGDVPVTLSRAVEALTGVEGIRVDAVSPLVRTAAVLGEGQAPQPDYWNAVVLARTSLDAHTLLGVTSGIEEELGRVRHEHWGARTVDIDIVQVAGTTSGDPTLTLPHPRAASRAFVLVPWALADPGATLEGAGAVVDLAAAAPDREGVRDAVEDWLWDPSGIRAESDAHLAGAVGAPERSSAETAPLPPASADPPGASPAASGGSAEDFLWQQLRKRHPLAAGWGSPEALPATGASPTTPRRGGAQDAVTPAPSAEAPTPEPGGMGPGSSDPGEAPGPAESTSPAPRRRRGPRWVPLRGRDAAPAAEDSGARAQLPTRSPEPGLALPEWDFTRSRAARVVDDAQDFTPEEPARTGSVHHGAVQRRSILDPDLPASVPTGPLEQDPMTQTSIMRGLTVRPSVTGQMPVTRRRGHGDRA